MATDFVEKFKRYLKDDGKSPKTIESYVGYIAGFVAYIQNIGVKFQGELKRFHVASFRGYLIESQNETATINKKINSLQLFNGFLMKNNYTSECVVDLRKDRIKVHLVQRDRWKYFRKSKWRGCCSTSKTRTMSAKEIG